jgi:hypothetical protein
VSDEGAGSPRDGAERFVLTRPFTATAAADARRRELSLRTSELEGKAGVSWTTLKYFGMLPHTRETLQRLSVALEWPPDHLWNLGRPRPARSGAAPVASKS